MIAPLLTGAAVMAWTLDRLRRHVEALVLARLVADRRPPWSADGRPARRIGRSHAAAASATLVSLVVFGRAGLGVVAAGVAARAYWTRRRRHDDRRRAGGADLVEFLDRVATAVRSGDSLRAAVVTVDGPFGEPFESDRQQLLADIADHDLDTALDRWAARPGAVPAGPVAAALRLGARLGGSSAAMLDAAAATVRARQAERLERHLQATQARASAALLALTPLVFLVVAALIDPGITTFLSSSPVGWAVLAGGAALDAAGFVWMQRIVDSGPTRTGARRGRHGEPVSPFDDGGGAVEVIDLFRLAASAGVPVSTATVEVAAAAPSRVHPALRAAADQVRVGHPVAASLDRVRGSIPPELQPLVAALQAADRYGTPLGPTLDRLAFEARAHERRRADEAARQVPMRLLIPLVVCVLPAFLMLTVLPALASTFEAVPWATLAPP